MKSKLVRESLIESSTSYDKKDYERMEKIYNMNDYNEQLSAVEKQSKLIKDPAKAYKRYLAAKDVGLQDRLARIFLDRAEDLGYDEAKKQKKQEFEEHMERTKAKARENKEKLMPIVNKITKSLDKMGVDYHVSLSSTYPMWNYDGVFISIDSYFEDAPYQGHTMGGPEYIGNYRPKVLGRELSKVRTIANRHNAGIFKYFNKYFIFLPFKRFIK